MFTVKVLDVYPGGNSTESILCVVPGIKMVTNDVSNEF
jgi:hypothetical protein